MTTRDALIPEAQRALVVTALYKDAHELNWTHLSTADRSGAYSAWVEDERIGGILTRYMTPEAARAWIKDGPMKEYRRALRGAGRYAQFGTSGGTTADDIVRASLGPEWSIIEGTRGVKPFHAHATDSSGLIAYLAWDESRNFKNLVWAAVRVSVELAIPGHVVVTEPPGGATPRDVVDRQHAIAKRCGLALHYVREQFGSPQS
ncbi:hypothetical protein [Brevibacterium casei]|uniref:hypothetical protein n=1 Tax=Brevibacterium casei TaxID=33889 RepID=UPI0036F6BB43